MSPHLVSAASRGEVAPLKRSSGGSACCGSRQVQLSSPMQHPCLAPCASTTEGTSSLWPGCPRHHRSLQQCCHNRLARPSQLGSRCSLSSTRCGMFGTPAAGAGITTEAWLAGNTCIQGRRHVLAGPPRQSYMLSAGDSSAGLGRSMPAYCNSKPAEPAAVHISAPCRTTQHAEQLQQGPPSAASAGAPAGPQAPTSSCSWRSACCCHSWGPRGAISWPPVALAGLHAADWASQFNQYPVPPYAAAVSLCADTTTCQQMHSTAAADSALFDVSNCMIWTWNCRGGMQRS